MSASQNLGTQFHDMTREEFEALPGTYFHGHPSGNFNWDIDGRPQGFHVGSYEAAEQAVTRKQFYGDGTPVLAPLEATKRESEGEMSTRRYEAHPDQIRGGRIVSPMVNSPHYLGSYGSNDNASYLGVMTHSGDALANGRVRSINTRGQIMRQGMYYRNQIEDAGSISAVLPNRQSFKTHEDYLVEARAQGKYIPERALKGYTQIPGQQKLF